MTFQKFRLGEEKVDGSYMSHLRFVDDIVVISSDPKEFSEMLQQLDQASAKRGLRMNLSKTK